MDVFFLDRTITQALRIIVSLVSTTNHKKILWHFASANLCEVKFQVLFDSKTPINLNFNLTLVPHPDETEIS